MGIIIDTSVIIATERKSIDFSQWQQYESAYISSITITELFMGVHRAQNSEIRIKRSAFVEHIVGSISSLTFGEEEARIYAHIINELYQKNITIGTHDMIIGATAIANGYPILTSNAKDFERIPGLEVISISQNNKKTKMRE